MITGFQQQQPWRLLAPVRSALQPQHGAHWANEPKPQAEPQVFTERTPLSNDRRQGEDH